MMPLTSQVADLTHEAVPKFTLDCEIPRLVVSVFAVSINRLRTEALVLQSGQERRDWEGEIGDVGGRERKAAGGALRRVAVIVILVGDVEDSITRADHGLTVETRRRPGQPEARPEVVVVRSIEWRAGRALSVAAWNIEYSCAVQDFVCYRVKLIP